MFHITNSNVSARSILHRNY
uniref:Uncharacterized protein n=1 Tax=Arundo donax TaxID=35708 RepID=A0A0A8Z7G8_ARUDO